MIIELDTLEPKQVYGLMVQTIIPRPIAWVLSDNGDGGHNLAPFSYFNGVASRPPLIGISIGRKPDGSRKDTWVNIDERTHFVVHVTPRDLLEPMVASSATLPHGESELSRLPLRTAPQPGFPLPRLVGPRVAMFCERYAIHEVGEGPQGLILGRVRAVWLDDAVARREGARLVVDAAAVDPVARLGGSEYMRFGDVASVARPR